MNKLAVFDCDDVLANLRVVVLDQLSVMLNRPVLLEELIHWDLSTTFGKHIDVDEMFRGIALETIPVEECAQALTRLLKQQQYRIEIVTARGYHTHAAQRTLNWCKMHNLPVDRVHVVPLHGEKRTTLANMGQIDLYVEDNHDHVEAAHELDNVRNIFLMNRPWNQHCEFGTRVNDLFDVFNHLT